MNRPERLNALGTELGHQLREAEDSFAKHEDAWVAICTAAGERAFSAGRDLKDAAGQDSPSGSTVPFARRSAVEYNKPTIAAVNGLACGPTYRTVMPTIEARACSHSPIVLDAFPSVVGAATPPRSPLPGPVCHSRAGYPTGRRGNPPTWRSQ